MNKTDYRELVILDLADENALLRDRVGSLEADVVAYRDLASTLLDVVYAWCTNPTGQRQHEHRTLKWLRELVVCALATVHKNEVA